MICNIESNTLLTIFTLFATIVVLNNIIMYILFGTKTYWYYSNSVEVYDVVQDKYITHYLIDLRFIIHVSITCILNFFAFVLFLIFGLLWRSTAKDRKRRDVFDVINQTLDV